MAAFDRDLALSRGRAGIALALGLPLIAAGEKPEVFVREPGCLQLPNGGLGGDALVEGGNQR
ncbi:MAG: hypothetical protein NVS9B1_22270 [Candidatus Dormibacteraceae bacterium]